MQSIWSLLNSPPRWALLLLFYRKLTFMKIKQTVNVVVACSGLWSQAPCSWHPSLCQSPLPAMYFPYCLPSWVWISSQNRPAPLIQAPCPPSWVSAIIPSSLMSLFTLHAQPPPLCLPGLWASLLQLVHQPQPSAAWSQAHLPGPSAELELKFPEECCSDFTVSPCTASAKPGGPQRMLPVGIWCLVITQNNIHRIV